MVHLPPDPHILASLANSGLPWWKALAEFVDNSIDAGATRVVIDVTKKVLTISDDGLGCDNVTSIFRLGDHHRQRSGRRLLGRYGIGAKDAWLSCSDSMDVTTRCNGRESRLSVNYPSWMASDWHVADPEHTSWDGPTGTTITLPLRPRKCPPSESAYRALAFAFTPAIRRGIQIVRSNGGRRQVLSPVDMPLRDDIVQAEFDVAGKRVAIDIGILPDGVSIERGPFWLIHGHRILTETSIGVGQYSARRLAGTITLGDGWPLSKNKDGLADHDEQLADAIFERLEPVLKKADQLAESIESSMLRTELEGVINSAIGDPKKEKRSDGDSIGSVRPRGTGQKRTRAAKTQDGNGSVLNDTPVGRKRGYLLDWYDDNPAVLGKFDRAGMRVSLNLKNGLIASAKSTTNRAALAACAVSLISDYCCRHDEDGYKLLKFSFTSFASAMGSILRDYTEDK
jgi:hypothetical protein